MSSDREKILELFEKHRAAPGSSFDESNFLDYLLSNPTSKRAVYNSFRGLRRFNSFLEEVQSEFSICFSLKDREANYALSKFIERVAELREEPNSSLASLRNQIKAGPGWHVLYLLNFILILLLVWLSKFPWIFGPLILCVVLLNLWFLRFAFRERVYHLRLLDKIEASKGVNGTSD